MLASLSGCGGVADNVTTHRVTVHSRQAALPLTIALRRPKNGAVRAEEHVVTDARGDASAAFRTGWGGFFFIIPPIGSVPRRPERPAFIVTARGQRFELSSASTETHYRWTNHSWQTEATISLP